MSDIVTKGLRFSFTCNELKEHCIDRSNYHLKRAEEKSVELPNIKDALEKVRASSNESSKTLSGKSAASFSNYHVNEDVVDDLEKDIQTHKEKSRVFKVYAEHLFETSYDLDISDLRQLEIIR